MRTAEQELARWEGLRGHVLRNDNANERDNAERALTTFLSRLEERARAADPEAIRALSLIRAAQTPAAPPSPVPPRPPSAADVSRGFNDLFNDLFQRRAPKARTVDPSEAPPPGGPAPFGGKGAAPPPADSAETAYRRRAEAAAKAAAASYVDPFDTEALAARRAAQKAARAARAQANAASPPPPAASPPPPPPKSAPPPPPPPAAAKPEEDGHRRRATLQHLSAALRSGAATRGGFPWADVTDVVMRGSVSYVDAIQADVVLRPGDPVTPGATWANVAILVDANGVRWESERPAAFLGALADLVDRATSRVQLLRLAP